MTEPVDIAALASAYIDDELDATERAAAENDPDVMATVAEFRQIAGLLRSPIAIDPAARERSIAAALDHLAGSVLLDPPASLAAPPPDVVTVTSPRPCRTRRSWQANPASMWGPIGLVAAALVAVAVISVRSNDDSGSSSAGTTFAAEVAASAKAGAAADESLSNDGAPAAAAAGATTAAGDATTVAAAAAGDPASQMTTEQGTPGSAASGITDLGVVASASELGARLVGRSATGASPSTALAPSSGAPTASPPTTCPDLGAPVAIARLDGTDVMVYADPRGGFVIVDGNCRQLSRLDAGGAVTP